nr:ribonuclease H-like domain-containing protein [Tanacetum cinerariifolium]
MVFSAIRELVDIVKKTLELVLPSYTRNYMPPRVDLSFVGLDDSIFKSKESNSKDENVFKPKELKKTVKPSFEKIEFVNAKNTSVEKKAKLKNLGSLVRVLEKFIPAAVLTKSGQVPVNTAKQSSHRAATSVSTARDVNTTAPRPKANDALPKAYSYFKAHLPIKSPFNQKSTVVSTAEGNRNNAVQHMTGNKSYLTNYQEIDGGFVASKGNAKGGKITSKGKIRTGKLDFEDVYFMKELKFNLFSISQMCDKKKNILFTDTECVVPSPDFKLLDESQVLLKVSRNNNMYSFDLNKVVPLGGIENQIDHTVKTIRCNNGTEFKNRIMNEFYEMKGIRREFSVARTQQNGRKPALSFMRPFKCLVTILDTLDYLGTKSNFYARQAEKKTASGLQYDPSKQGDKDGQEKDVRDQEEALRKQFDQDFSRLSGQREAANTNSTNRLNTVSSPVNADANTNSTYRMFTLVSTSGSFYFNHGGSILVNVVTLPNVDLLTDPLMPDLEDTKIFSGAYDDEVEGAVADLNNLELTIVVSPIPTTRIHKDHPKE